LLLRLLLHGLGRSTAPESEGIVVHCLLLGLLDSTVGCAGLHWRRPHIIEHIVESARLGRHLLRRFRVRRPLLLHGRLSHRVLLHHFHHVLHLLHLHLHLLIHHLHLWVLWLLIHHLHLLLHLLHLHLVHLHLLLLLRVHARHSVVHRHTSHAIVHVIHWHTATHHSTHCHIRLLLWHLRHLWDKSSLGRLAEWISIESAWLLSLLGSIRKVKIP